MSAFAGDVAAHEQTVASVSVAVAQCGSVRKSRSRACFCSSAVVADRRHSRKIGILNV